MCDKRRILNLPQSNKITRDIVSYMLSDFLPQEIAGGLKTNRSVGPSNFTAPSHCPQKDCLEDEFTSRTKSILFQMVRSERLYDKQKAEISQLKFLKPGELWQEILLSVKQPTVKPNLNGVIWPDPRHQISAVYNRERQSEGRSTSCDPHDIQDPEQYVSLAELCRWIGRHGRSVSAEECAALRLRLCIDELTYREFLCILL